VESLRDHVTMPEFFTNAGYTTATYGKIYHALEEEHRSREFQIWGEVPPAKRPPARLGAGDTGGTVVDWGRFPERDEEMRDYMLADAAIEQLRNMPRDNPFFLTVGFWLPHVPCYAPSKWFDRVPEDQVILPPILRGDRQDTPEFSWYLHWLLPEPRLSWYDKFKALPARVQAYLAVTTFMDAQVGRLLAALKETGHEEDTIVVFAGDHGYHLGEKEITGKNTLWDRGTRVPFVIAGPGIPRRVVNDPAELLDIYPTLVELAGFPAREGLDGHSLAPQIQGERRTFPAITTHNVGNHGIRTDRWRYIRYADGSEELYNMFWDSNEWTNLASDPKYRGVKEELAQWLPKEDAPPIPPATQARVLAPTGDGGWMWEGKRIVPGQIPASPQPIGMPTAPPKP
jgi:arylsulfatase A-like enzyme